MTIKKDGRAKFDYLHGEKWHIFKVLKELGFGQALILGKQQYYRVIGDTIKGIRLIDMRDAFEDYLQDTVFEDLPQEYRHDLLNWFYDKLPIKKTPLLDNHLKGTLTDDQIHDLSMENVEYKIHYNTDQTLSLLADWGFETTLDTAKGFSNGLRLYYKEIEPSKSLVFIHYDFPKQLTSTFRVVVAKYPKGKDITQVEPIDITDIEDHFDIDNHKELIQQYLDS